MEGYHESTTPSVTLPAGRLGPYERIVTYPIQLVLNAIVAHCDVGGCITPGIRQLADWSSVSRGQITAHLRQLDEDGWICYDGRVIMLLRHPDESESDRSADRSLCEDAHDVIDRLIDQPDGAPESDRSTDRSDLPRRPRRLLDRVLARQSAPERDDRSTGRSVLPPGPPMEIMIHEQQESAAAALNRIPWGASADRPVDRSPAAQLLAELGADEAIIADAQAAQPDLTPQQIRDTWAWHAWRRERDPGLGEGVFFKAIRNGQIHAPPPDPQRPIAVEQYQPPPDDSERALNAAFQRARGLAPPGTPRELLAKLVNALLDGATDDQALDLLAAHGAAPRPEPPAAPPPNRRAGAVLPAYVPPRWQRGRR